MVYDLRMGETSAALSPTSTPSIVLFDSVCNLRYRWFGKAETCWLPTPELKARFL